MKLSEIVEWYESIESSFGSLKKNHYDTYGSGTKDNYNYDKFDAQRWATEASSALAAIFSTAHPVRQNWERLSLKMDPAHSRGLTLEQMGGVFATATSMVKNNRIGSIIDAIRAETEGEILEQAIALLTSGHVATVIAGGALETHLRQLIKKNNLPVVGEGSISKFDSAAAKARNDGTATLYSAIDSKLITGWGGIRNEAAHSPGAFSRSHDDVKRMIDGILEFIARTS